MHKVKKLTILTLTISIILLISLSLAGPLFDALAGPLAQTSPTLGAAESYSVLAGETVTNTGDTTMPGDLGVYPGSAVTGDPSVGPPGTIHAGDDDARLAQEDNTAAFGVLDQPCTTSYAGVQDLTTVSPLEPGVYCADAFELSGNLELSGSGVWIFKSEATLITSSESSVSIPDGDPCDVWWRVASSATLGTNTSFIGNILALTDIALNTGATLDGRALAQTGQVTLDNNTITGNTCLPSAPTDTATASPTDTAAAPTATAAAQTATAEAPTATAAALTATAAALTAPSTTPVAGLPDTGGAPIQDNADRPWSLVVAGGFTAIALALGLRGYLRSRQPK